MSADEERVSFSADPQVFELAERAFKYLRLELGELLGQARIEHVGGTALPGTLTKGDLDVQVIVAREEFARAKETLAKRYEANEGAFASAESASFKDEKGQVPIGIHLTVAGCSDDFQWRLRDLLLARPEFRRAYEALKRGHEGRPMADYRKAKEAFFTEILAAARPGPG